MRLRTVGLVFALAVLIFPLASEAQQTGEVYRIGYLAIFPTSEEDGFRQVLRDLGYSEGRNIIIDRRYAEKYERLPDLAAALVNAKPDLIVTVTTPAAWAVKRATTVIPIVMTHVADPVGSGLVATLAAPGGNITGVSALQSDLYPKGLQLLKEVIPELSKVAWVWNPTNRAAVSAWKQIQAVAPSAGVALQPVAIRTADDLDVAFAQLVATRPHALFVTADHVLLSARARIVEFTKKNRLPAIYGQKQYVEAGGLMFFGPDRREMFRRAATYVDKILKGARPADLPVEQPTKFELVINLKTAKALGLTIPPSLLLRADHVIE